MPAENYGHVLANAGAISECQRMTHPAISRIKQLMLGLDILVNMGFAFLVDDADVPARG